MIDSPSRLRGFVHLGGKHLWVNLAPAAGPGRGHGGAGTCVVLCYPLLEERLNSHPYYVWFAEHLAKKGVTTVRFDYPGTGESLPVTEMRHLAEYGRAISDVVDWVRSEGRFRRVGLLGLTSASLAMARADATADFAIFWEPLLESAYYSRMLFRANILQQQTVHGRIVQDTEALRADLAAGMTFSVEGHAITQTFVDSVEDTPPLTDLLRSRPGPIVSLGRRSHARLEQLFADEPEHRARLLLAPVAGSFWSSGFGGYLDLPLGCMTLTERWIIEETS